MQRDSTFTGYPSPFKLKESSYASSSHRKHSSSTIQVSIPKTNHLSISPYRMSRSKKVGKAQPLRTADMPRQRALSGSSSAIKIRTFSANYLSTAPKKFVEVCLQQQGDKMKTSRAVFTRSISAKNIRTKCQLTFKNDHHHNERKFIISVVSIDKKKEKSRRLMNEKLEKFNYKTVLGGQLPFKKIPKLFIDEHGTVSRQHL